MSYIRTEDKTDLYVKDWGAGQPVILLHGWPLSSDSWDAQAMAIADAGYRAIAYDRRGFGRSSQAWSGYDYDTLSDDLAAVIKHTQAKDAIIVGFSMGGGEVARYMSRHEGKSVAKAALISSIVPFLLIHPSQTTKHKAITLDNLARRHGDRVLKHSPIKSKTVKFTVLSARVNVGGQIIEESCIKFPTYKVMRETFRIDTNDHRF